MRFRWLWLAGVVGLAGVLLCAAFFALSGEAPASASGARLLEVSAVGPRVLERGESLRISGAGFPAGRTAQVTLRGVLHRAGARPHAVRAELAGVAASVDRIEVVLDPAALSQLGGEGSFDGTLEVAFAAREGRARVTGGTQVSFDVLGSRQALRLSAERMLASVGLVAADAELMHGLRVGQLEQGGLAERAGLRPGDVITAAADVRVHALADLAPAPGATALSLRVERALVHEPLALSLPLSAASAATHASFDGRLLRLHVLWVFLLLVLAFASPLPSPTPLVSRLLDFAERVGSKSALHGQLPALAFAAPVALLLAGAWPIDAMYLALFGVAASGSLVVLRVRDSGDRRELLGAMWEALALVVIVGCVAAQSGTRSLSGVVAVQGVAPFSWHVFTHPQLGLGLLSFVAHAARLTARPVRAGQSARLIEACAKGILSLSAACLFLGGNRVSPDAPAALWLSSAWLLLKTSAVLFGLAVAYKLAEGWPRRLARELGRVSLVLLGSALWLLVSPSRDTELAIGGVLGSAVLLTALLATLEAKLSRRAASRTEAKASAR